MEWRKKMSCGSCIYSARVLSVDAKPRLKWTPQLHERFVNAVSQLGGEEKATPKSVMHLMGVPGITLYHLKSHLQKFRLAKGQELNTAHNVVKQGVVKQDCVLTNIRKRDDRSACSDMDQTNQSLFNAPMLEMQLEAQRKLQEQIQVQKHLQLRIEAQGKYLQTVLTKAQETLVSYSSSSSCVEAVKVELSEIVSAVDMECTSSSFCGRNLIPKRAQHEECSTESCLTSTDRHEKPEGKRPKLEDSPPYNWIEEPYVINLNRSTAIEMQPDDRIEEMKSNCSSICDHVKERSMHQMENCFVAREELDLNR